MCRLHIINGLPFAGAAASNADSHKYGHYSAPYWVAESIRVSIKLNHGHHMECNNLFNVFTDSIQLTIRSMIQSPERAVG